MSARDLWQGEGSKNPSPFALFRAFPSFMHVASLLSFSHQGREARCEALRPVAVAAWSSRKRALELGGKARARATGIFPGQGLTHVAGTSSFLLPSSNGLQPNSDGLHLVASCYYAYFATGLMEQQLRCLTNPCQSLWFRIGSWRRSFHR